MFPGFLLTDRENDWGAINIKKRLPQESLQLCLGRKKKTLKKDCTLLICWEKKKNSGTLWCFIVTHDWQPASAHARVWWITKRWKSKEVESLTDNKSSSPFWQECRRRRKKKSRERRDVRWKQCQLRAECIDYSENENRPLMSLAAQAAIWHMRADQAGADRLNHSRAEKCVFLSIEYVSVLHFKD